MRDRLLAAILALLALGAPAAADPPPFGTVLDQWNLPLGGAYNGADITWNPERNRFYLVNQGYSSQCGVWTLDPANPTGTLARVPWQYVELGTSTTDIPYGICWDSDSGCFWLSQIVDGNIYGECYLMRYNWSGDSLTWGGTPTDSWLVASGSWIGGMDRWRGRGFLGVEVFGPGFLFFDPYTKTRLNSIGDTLVDWARGLTVVPFDSNYVLSSGMGFGKYDSAGRLLQFVDYACCGHWTLLVPTSSPSPGDTVCAWCMCTSANNALLRVSLGMLWSQLPHQTGIYEEREAIRPGLTRPASIVRGVLDLKGTDAAERGAELLDINGRKALDLAPGPNDITALAPGVYFLGPESGGSKVIIQR